MIAVIISPAFLLNDIEAISNTPTQTSRDFSSAQEYGVCFPMSKSLAKIYDLSALSEAKFKRRSIVASKCAKVVLAPFEYKKPSTLNLFKKWVTKTQSPNYENQVIITDDEIMHQSLIIK